MYDLNIKIRNNERERVTLLKRAFELGWKSIAWNTCVLGKVSAAKAKVSSSAVISRVDLDEIAINRKLVTSDENTIVQLNRITMTIDDVYDAQSITASNDTLKQFDIVAVCPGNAKVFSYLCKTADVDIICIDFSHKLSFPINKKLLDEAIKRGIFFEINYSPMIQSAAVRREVISGTRVFLQFMRGKNLIISSGCDSINSMRGPFDAVNIGNVLKLTNEQAIKAISDNCELLLKHGAARKLKFQPIEVVCQEEAVRQNSKVLKRKRSVGNKPRKITNDQSSCDEDENDGSDLDSNIDISETRNSSNETDARSYRMDPNLISHKENDDFGADDDKIDLDDIKGKIFIGGLSWQTSEANLRYYFEKFGELSDVALMIDKRTGKPRGFGFIKMKDPAAADIVMSTEHTIDGRLVDVKRALPRDKAPGPTRSEACKIFVGGLAPEITEKEFGDYFSKFGIVKDAVVMVDRNTGSSRGFGFVTFEAEETVEQVMKIQHEIMGKYVEIKRAEPRDSRSTVGGYDNGAQGGMYGGMGGYGGRMATGGGRGGPMNNNMGGPRYGQPGGNTGMMGANGYGGANMAVAGGYGGYMGAPGAMRPGAPAGPAQSYNRYPAGYGGAAAAYGRGAGGYGGMSTPTAGYGYPNPAAISPQGMGGYYGGAAMPAPAAGYGGYGSTTAPPQGPVGAQPAAYGGAAQYSPTGGRPGAFPAEGADFNGAPVDGRAGQPQGMKDGYDSSAIAAGYANAAAMQMRAQQQQPQFSYGGAAMAPAGYGGAAYGVYGAAVAAPPQGAAAARLPAGAGIQEPAQQYGNDQQSNYGAYRGQGATQGRVDRSYRPY